ncbi:MAG: hypothetical protein KKG33_06615 [candidate division Zixibacteria bacterium]|nr:hypothetical protein [candidate division Zixibacteria bacterium]MBU1470197.1 hypothetical protein [candidate division Zixibacteria bacterium]MBU2625214.1 hypothetical protein [candidate division Zixibacteria bacterium]
MKNLHLSALVALGLALLFAAAGVAEDAPWMDMQKCDMCRPLMEQPGLLEHTTWEHHNISNGVISITTVDPAFMPQYEMARAKMGEVGKKFETGEKVELCQMCTAMGTCFAKGLKAEMVQTKHGDVHMMTSDDPAVVAEIQAWAKRTNDEMAKFEAAEETKMEKK